MQSSMHDRYLHQISVSTLIQLHEQKALKPEFFWMADMVADLSFASDKR